MKKYQGPVQIKSIRYPLWSRPALLYPGGNLKLILTSLAGQGEILLTLDGSSVPLSTSTPLETGKELYQFNCTIPRDQQPGLYGLEVNSGRKREYMPACIRIFPRERDFEDISLVHITDPHISLALTGDSDQDLHSVVSRINQLDPDLVLLTGDLISRYGRNKEILPPCTVKQDLIRAQRLLLDLDCPLFITAGNHDLAFSWLRRYYDRYIAPFQVDRYNGYSFRLGGYRFLTFEGFRYYDAFPPVSHTVSPSPEQLSWLKEQLENSCSDLMRIMFYHYDYSDQLPTLFDRYRVNLALAGHTTPMIDEDMGCTPTYFIRDPSVYGKRFFRLIHLKGGRIAACKRSDELDQKPKGGNRP